MSGILNKVNNTENISFAQNNIAPSTTDAKPTINVPIGEKSDVSNNIKILAERFKIPEDLMLQIMNQYPDFTTKSDQEKTEIVSSYKTSSNEVISESNNRSHEHAKIDTTSEKWQKMTDSQRLKFVLDENTKAFVGDKWEKFNSEEKFKAVQDYVNFEFSEHVKDWDKLTDEQKLDKIGEVFTMFDIAKKQHINPKELINLKLNNPDEYKKNYDEYAKDNAPITYCTIQDVYKKEENATQHVNGLLEYYGCSNLSELKEPSFAEYSYLKQLDKSSMNELQEIRLETYNDLEKNIGERGIKNLRFGKTTLYDLFTKEQLNDLGLENPDQSKSKDEKIAIYKRNQDKMAQALMPEILRCKTVDDFDKMFAKSGLDISAINAITQKIRSMDNPPKEFIEAYNQWINTDNTAALTSLSVDADAIEKGDKTPKWVQEYNSTKGIERQNDLIKQGILDIKNSKNIVRLFAKSFDADNAALINRTTLETGNVDLAEAAINGVGEREDAQEVFAISNKQIANSNKISDEMKEFYAQNSIVALKSPEARQAQTDDLGKYKLESFDKGTQKGFETVRLNESKVSEKSFDTVQKSTSETFTKVTSSDPKVTTFVEETKKIDWDSAEGTQKFVELADQHSYEFSKVLNQLSNTDKEKVIDKFCQNASAQQILKLIQNNPSLYSEILKSSGSKLNIFSEQIFKILISNGEDMVKIAKDLNINLFEFAETNKEFATKIALKTQNESFARKMLKDSVFYGILPGAKDYNDLCQLASQKNIEKANQDPPIPPEKDRIIPPPKIMIKS